MALRKLCLNALDYGFDFLVALAVLGGDGCRIHLPGKRVGIMANLEGANDAVIGSWSFLLGYAFANNKNFIGKGLNIIAIFHDS